MSEATIKKIILDLPAMYADHHVMEVRRLLTGMPGIQDVYASSAYKVVEATYDTRTVSEEAIRKVLDEAGYMGELVFPRESGEEAKAGGVFFRHTAAYQPNRAEVSFGQNVDGMGRPLWPCPGMGVIKKMEE
jgi:copper chaperone CopZ